MIFKRENRLEKNVVVLNINKDIFYIYYCYYLKKNIIKSHGNNALNATF